MMSWKTPFEEIWADFGYTIILGLLIGGSIFLLSLIF